MRAIMIDSDTKSIKTCKVDTEFDLVRILEANGLSDLDFALIDKRVVIVTNKRPYSKASFNFVMTDETFCGKAVMVGMDSRRRLAPLHENLRNVKMIVEFK